MAGRNRNTKALAQRIDRQYFKRMFPLQRWRWILGSAAVGIGLLWVGLHSISRSNTVYSAGPLTPAHAMLNRKCSACHVRSGIFAVRVTDQACSACHDGAVHRVKQTFTPQCIDCHTEHTPARLTAVGDRECVACHGNLKVTGGQPKVAAAIHSFDGDHPEFALIKAPAADPGTVKFNHAVHLKKDLRGVKGNVTLVCADCHRASNNEPWPYGRTRDASAPAAETNRKYMDPVNYYQHCSTCHPLRFDRRFSDPVPHKTPDGVHAFLTEKFTQWIAAHPQELRGEGIRIAEVPPQPAPRNAGAWVEARVSEAEQLLRVKTCKECHEVTPIPQGIPEIPRAQLTARWLHNAEFDHSAHQMLVCDGCHKQALTSTKTSDVLLPGIAVCRLCHTANKADAARANCVECHVYHDPAKRKHVDGKFTLDQVSGLH